MLDEVFVGICGAEKMVDGYFAGRNDFQDFVPLMTAAYLLIQKEDVRQFCEKILWVKRNEQGETYHVENILEEIRQR